MIAAKLIFAAMKFYSTMLIVFVSSSMPSKTLNIWKCIMKDWACYCLPKRC